MVVAGSLRSAHSRVPGGSASASAMSPTREPTSRGVTKSFRRLNLAQRVEAASALLEELGALYTVERVNGSFVIRGPGCLLAAAVHGRRCAGRWRACLRS
jgi:hypothetical protein